MSEDDFGLLPQMDSKPLALSKDEGIRSIALMLAIKHVDATVVSDGALYQAIRMAGHELKPLTNETVIAAALRFEAYIRCGENPERMALISAIADQLDEESMCEDEEPSREKT